MSLDQVVNADAEEELASEDEDEIFFQDIDMLQNHGIVSLLPGPGFCLSFNCILIFSHFISRHYSPPITKNILLVTKMIAYSLF